MKMQVLLASVIRVGLFMLAPGAVAHRGSGGGAGHGGALARHGYYRGPIDGCVGAGDSQCNSIIPSASGPTSNRSSGWQLIRALQS